MSVSTTHSYEDFLANGAVGQALALTFQFFEKEHISVKWSDAPYDEGSATTLTYGVDFTVDARPPTLPNTGTVRLVLGVTNGKAVRVRRTTPKKQLASLSTSGGYSPAAIMRSLDEGILIDQEIADGNTASIASHGVQGGGNLHSNAVRGGAAGFLDGAILDQLLDHVEIIAGNPHGTTAAQVSAAPLTHVGANGTGVHGLADAANPGFMSKEHWAIVDGLAPGSSLTNVLLFDHFDGAALKTSTWARTTSGTAPTASFPTGFQYGVYRETTAAANPSVVLLRSGTKVKPSSTPSIRFAAGVGAAGPSYANILAMIGAALDPSTLATHYAYFRFDPGGTVTAVSRAAGAEQTTGLGALATLFGVPPADTAVHEYRIEFDGTSSVKFYVGGVLKATHSTEIPGSTQLLEPFVRNSNSGGAVAQSLDVDYVYVTAPVAY